MTMTHLFFAPKRGSKTHSGEKTCIFKKPDRKELANIVTYFADSPQAQAWQAADGRSGEARLRAR
jgi:hypothetical protein